MPTHALNHVNIRVPSQLLDALKDFYTEVIGLHTGFRPPFPSSGYWLYAGNQAVVHLSEADASEARPTHVETTFDHFAFDCSNRAEFESTLNRHGVNFETRVVPLTNQVQLFLQDPAGNKVELNFAGPDA